MIPETFSLPTEIIDTHCHGRDLEQSYKTTVEQVLREAQSAQIAITIFQPNTAPAITNQKMLKQYLEIISRATTKLKIKVKQYVWFGATDDNLEECRLALKNKLVVGLKDYPVDAKGKSVTTGSSIGVARDETIISLMKFVREANKALAIHCDDPQIIKSEGYTIRAEVEYLKKIIRLANLVPGVKLIICHVSCWESANLILEAQRKGLKIAMEIMPHYLWFDNEGTNWQTNLDPIFYHCFNKLRGSEDQKLLCGLLKLNNPLIWIASDSACHTQEEKINKRFGGIPSNQEMVPVVLTLAIQLGLSEKRVAELLSWNAASFLDIPVSRATRQYRLEEKIDELTYNNGIVVNPWNGSKLIFPYPV
jgi:dihydroorotase